MNGWTQPIHFRMYGGRMVCFASGISYFTWMPTKADLDAMQNAETVRKTYNGRLPEGD